LEQVVEQQIVVTSIGPFVAAQLAAKLAQSATEPPAASAAEHTNPQRKQGADHTPCESDWPSKPSRFGRSNN